MDKAYDLTIKARLVIKDGSTRQVASLLAMSAENILESLTTHIQTEMITPMPAAPTTKDESAAPKAAVSEEIGAKSVGVPPSIQAGRLVEKEAVMDPMKVAKPAAASFAQTSRKTVAEAVVDPMKERIIKVKEEIPALKNYEIVEIDEDSPEFAKLSSKAEAIDMMQLKKMSTPPSQEDFNKMWVKVPDNMTIEEYIAMDSNASLASAPTTKYVDTQLITEPAPVTATTTTTAANAQTVPVEEPLLGRQLFEWPKLIDPKQRAVVISCVQSWAYNYTARGIGMEAIKTAHGVNISFAISSSASLSICLNDHRSKSILTSHFIDVDIDDRDRALLDRVTKKLESSVQKFVSELDVGLVDTDAGEVVEAKELNSSINGDDDGWTGPNAFRKQMQQRLDGFNDNEEFLGYLDELSTTSVSSSQLPLGGKLLNDYVQPIPSSQTQTATPRAAKQSLPKQPAGGSRKRDPAVMAAAADLGLKMESFENRGLEEQAIEELNNMVRNAQEQGFLQVIRSYRNNQTANATVASAVGDGMAEQPDLSALTEEGMTRSREHWQSMLNRTGYLDYEDLSRPTPTLPIDLKAGGLKGEFDLFSGPPLEGQGSAQDPRAAQIESLSSSTLPASDPATIEVDIQRLSLLMNELQRAPSDMQDEIIESYRDLLLSGNMIYLLLQANRTEQSYDNRLLYSKISQQAAKFSLELVSLMNQESMRHLQTIYDVCDIAQKYQHRELLFLEHLDYVKPRFDTAFLAYLNFAIEEEKRNQRSKGYDATRYPSKWLLILTVIRQGVQAEFEQRYERILEPLLLVVRFEQKFIREDLFHRFVNQTAPIDLQYMRTLALNMVDNIRANLKQNPAYVDQELYARLVELEGYVQLYLSEEYIEEKMAEFTETARKQGMEILLAHRNPMVRQEMDLQQDLENYRRKEQGIGGDSDADGKVGLSILDRPRATATAADQEQTPAKQ
jgi:hypothetical protein